MGFRNIEEKLANRLKVKNISPVGMTPVATLKLTSTNFPSIGFLVSPSSQVSSPNSWLPGHSKLLLNWFSVGICKYKPSYKSHDLLQIHMLWLADILFKKENIYNIFSAVWISTVISTIESTEVITGHVIYNLAYNYKFELKTT